MANETPKNVGMLLGVIAGLVWCAKELEGRGGMGSVVLIAAFVWGVLAAVIRLQELSSEVRKYQALVKSKGIDPLERHRFPG